MKGYKLEGKIFEYLTVVERSTEGRWLCKCICGRQTKVRTGRLLKKETVSCGKCGRAGKYGQISKHYLYQTWRNICGRCLCPGQTHYRYYGGRGIRLHKSWQKNYSLFYTYIITKLGERPSSKHTLDRINSNGHYTPGNLRWADKALQSANRRSTS